MHNLVSIETFQAFGISLLEASGPQIRAYDFAIAFLLSTDFSQFEVEGGEDAMIVAIMAATDAYVRAGGVISYERTYDFGVIE